MRHNTLLVVAIAAAVSSAPGCNPASRPPNVILVSIDTLRADHVGSYGYAKETTPSIDTFRRDAAQFDEAIAHAPSTLPSHASMLTSLLPSHHGASVANSFALDPGAITLAEILKAEGYDTASFNGGIQLDPIYGLDRGFDVYAAARPSVALAELLVDPIDMFDHTVDAAIDWIGAHRDAPFFLFLHTYELHHPYTPSPEFLALFEAEYDGALPRSISVDLLRRINDGKVELEAGDLAHIISTYDAELRSVDAAFGRFIDFLRDEGLYDDAIIVLTSDHGEEFGEHGFVGWHSHTLFDELLRVPLIVKLPGMEHAGASVDSQVRGIDIAPTILDTLEVDVPTSFEGTSLRGPLTGSAEVPEYAVSRKDLPVSEDFASIRTPEWKWFPGHLYHIAKDALETKNAAKTHEPVAAALKTKLDELRSDRPTPPPNVVKPDEELLEKLRALGYIE